jgi:hypothetical protein
MHSLWQSLKAYGSALGWWGWTMTVGFLSGVGGLIADAAFHVGPLHMPLWAWLALIISTAVLAPFAAFHKLYQEYMRISAELVSRRPDFVGEIQMVGVARSQRQNCALVTIFLRITNRGEPCAIPNLGVKAILRDGRTIKGEKIAIDQPIVMTGDPQQVTRIVQPFDAIYHKAATPIPKNGFIMGVLVALFREAQQRELEIAGTEFIVTFSTAVDGREFCCAWDLRYGDGPGDIHHRFTGDTIPPAARGDY